MRANSTGGEGLPLMGTAFPGAMRRGELRRGGVVRDGWGRAWVGWIRPSVVGSREDVVGRNAQDDDGVAQLAGSTSRVDRDRVGDEFTLEDLHRGEGSDACL